MHAFLSVLAHATLLALVLAAVAAVFKALGPARDAATTEVAAPAAKPAPAEPSAEIPAVAPGGRAKGHNLDLFGGWPEGYVPPTPAEVKAQVARVLKVRVSVELHEQLMAEAQARGQALGTCVRDLLQEQIGASEPAADLVAEASMADTPA
jgi:hypothetical protein